MKSSVNKSVGLAMLIFMNLIVAASGQNSEIDQLRSAVKAMQETINNLSTNLANANARLAEIEKQSKAAQAAPVEASGVPPATHPGAMPNVKPEPPKSDLADETTPIPYQDTINEDAAGAARPGNAPIDPTYQGFMQL